MDFVGKRRWFFITSGVFILVGLLSLAIPPALHLGIDFTGGSTISVKFDTPVSEEAVRNELIKLRHPEATIQSSGNTDYFIRTATLKEGNVLTGAPSERVQLETALGELGTILRTPEFSSVGGVIARGLDSAGAGGSCPPPAPPDPFHPGPGAGWWWRRGSLRAG